VVLTFVGLFLPAERQNHPTWVVLMFVAPSSQSNNGRQPATMTTMSIAGPAIRRCFRSQQCKDEGSRWAIVSNPNKCTFIYLFKNTLLIPSHDDRPPQPGWQLNGQKGCDADGPTRIQMGMGSRAHPKHCMFIVLKMFCILTKHLLYSQVTTTRDCLLFHLPNWVPFCATAADASTPPVALMPILI